MTSAHPELKTIMTTAEVASALGASPKAIRRLAHEGILKNLRGTRSPMKFSGVKVREWLEGQVRS